MTADSAQSSHATRKTADHDPLADRFKVEVGDCDVNDKKKLVQYRDKWKHWMSWYRYSESQPNSIESQMHRMFFNDLTYRATVSVRESVSADIAISARSSTLAYLLDQGYVVSQVLSLQKLLDPKNNVISVKRLLKDIRKHRGLITREVYVAGSGLPYDYNSWTGSVDNNDITIRLWGLNAPGLLRFAVSKQLHETFDRLSGKHELERNREDVIPQSIFKILDSWISGPSAREIGSIRNNFIAHSPDALQLGTAQFTGVRLSQIDDLQRAIIRVERALTDHILSIRIGRDVVPSPPLGIFRGLDLPYSPSEAEASMHRRWNDLREERDRWKNEVLQDLTSNFG